MAADNPADIKMNAKVSANFDPLIKATPKGLDRLFSLAFDKREADNLRYKMLLAAQTQKECQQILSGESVFENGRLIPVGDSENAKSWSILQIEAEQEGRNLAGNILMAAEALKDTPDEQVSDKEVDEDFFARWRREAKVIGNEEIQRLWGRLLAEEIIQPNSVPFRVLDILKNISSAEAKLFRRLDAYICDTGTLVCDFTNKYYPDGIEFDDYIKLQECGFIVGANNFIAGRSDNRMTVSGGQYFEVNFANMVVAVDTPSDAVIIQGAALTSAGKVAHKICDHDEPSMGAIQYICSVIWNETFNTPDRLLCFRKKVASSNYSQEASIFELHDRNE